MEEQQRKFYREISLEIQEKGIYKLFHKPTGLFFIKSKGPGLGNLSIKGGKIYSYPPYIPDKKIIKLPNWTRGEISDAISKWLKSDTIPLHVETKKEEWEIIKIKII